MFHFKQDKAVKRHLGPMSQAVAMQHLQHALTCYWWQPPMRTQQFLRRKHEAECTQSMMEIQRRCGIG